MGSNTAFALIVSEFANEAHSQVTQKPIRKTFFHTTYGKKFCTQFSPNGTERNSFQNRSPILAKQSKEVLFGDYKFPLLYYSEFQNQNYYKSFPQTFCL